jgi:KDO2-lipid IV(A) lauroyltransferase
VVSEAETGEGQAAAVKPKRQKRPPPPAWLQNILFVVEVILYDFFHLLVRALPVDTASDFGGWLLKTLGPLTSTHKTVVRNFQLAFPDMPKAERDRLIEKQWENCGRVFAEFPILDRLTPSTGRVEVINGERLDAIREAGKPVVFVSGHFSNWEIMPLTIVHFGVVCEMTYRAANNPYVDKRIKESRARYGVKLFAPKGGDGARELLEGMKAGASVALMNDQKFNRGIPVPFFGHDAYTAPGPTRLALKFGTVLQTMTVRRLKGARFQAIVHEPIELERTNDRAHDIEVGVRRITAFVEDEVRNHPEDWFWVHKRWPNEVYAALDSDVSR